MRSRLAAEVRDELHGEVQRLTPDERVRLALELGARDLATFAAAQGLSPEEARRRLRSAAQRGRRRPSACAG